MRIRAESLEDLFFRQNDNPPTRAQKLELLRNLLMDFYAEFKAHSHPEIDTANALAYRVPGFFTMAPPTGEVLLLHSLVNDVYVYPEFEGSEAAVGQPPTAIYACPVYRNPITDADGIIGGEVVGWLTFDPSGAVTWATQSGRPAQFFKGDVLGIKAPDLDATIRFGSFTVMAWIGFVANTLAFTPDGELVALSGDMQDGDSLIILSGDQQFDEPFVKE